MARIRLHIQTEHGKRGSHFIPLLGFFRGVEGPAISFPALILARTNENRIVRRVGNDTLEQKDAFRCS